MYRLIEKDLLNWKDSPYRKPLIIRGARQTGKTHIIREFGLRNYEDVIELNFENNQAIHGFFEKDLNPENIITNLELYYNKRIVPGKTLLFFDEIQSCPPAITSLKYFNENANQYHIICAGSLLGVAINRKFNGKEFSYPVGKVESLRLYPMNFEEFLIALDEILLHDLIQDCYNNNKPLNPVLHDKALKLYRDYLTIGGMPEAIKVYIETKSLLEATLISKQIYEAYLNDTSKYATAIESAKNYSCYDSIAKQLLKTNKNFKYSEVQKGKTSQYFNSSIEWLIQAGIALKSSLIESPRMPLSFHKNEFLFRIYLSDVALFRYKANINLSNIQNIEYRDDMTGILAENYVACELTSYTIPLYYWTGKSEAEIEFITEYKNNVVPIEVKSGRRITSKSLNVFKENYSTNQVFRISQKNFGLENEIKSVPLYAVYCLAKEIIKK